MSRHSVSLLAALLVTGGCDVLFSELPAAEDIFDGPIDAAHPPELCRSTPV